MTYDIPEGYYWSLCAVMLVVLAYQFRIQFPSNKRRATKMQEPTDEPDPGPKDYMDLAPGVYRAKNLVEVGGSYPTRRLTADLLGVGTVLFIVQDFNYHREGWPACFHGEFNVKLCKRFPGLGFRHLDTIPLALNGCGWDNAPPTPLSEFPDLDDLFNGE